MKNTILTAKILFLYLLIPFLSYSNEGNLYKVSLKEKVDSSLFVFSGEVVSKNSYWNLQNTLIYTDNIVEVTKFYKGEPINSTFTIRTVGGTVGSSTITTSSLLSLNTGDKGVFFCRATADSTAYEAYSSRQGFIRYSSDGLSAICPLYKKSKIIFKTNSQNLPELN